MLNSKKLLKTIKYIFYKSIIIINKDSSKKIKINTLFMTII